MHLREVLRVLRSFVGNFLSLYSRLALYMMLYKRRKNEYERIIMNDDWAEQKCCEPILSNFPRVLIAQFQDICLYHKVGDKFAVYLLYDGEIA